LGALLLVIFTALTLLAPATVSDAISGSSLIVRLIITVLVVGIFLLIAYIQVRRRQLPPPETGLTVRTSGAITVLSVASARERILKAVSSLSDVTSVDADLKAVHGKADIALDVVVSGDTVNVPEKQKEIDRALEQVIHKQLGLQMAGRAHVHIRFPGELTELAPPVRVQPATPTPVASVPPPEPLAPLQPAESEPHGGLPGGLLRPKPSEETPSAAESEPELPAPPEPEPREEKLHSGLLGGLFAHKSSEQAPSAAEAKPESPPPPEAKSATEQDDQEWAKFVSILKPPDKTEAPAKEEPPEAQSPPDRGVDHSHESSDDHPAPKPE
jgi:hypothetical protein